MKCPDCGTEAHEGDKICSVCGSDLSLKLPPDLYIQRSSSPKMGMAYAGMTVDFLENKLEYRQEQQMRAALEANPEAARRMARNRMLLKIVPLIIAVIFILIILLIP